MLPVRSNILVDWATCLFSKLFIAGIGMMVAHTIPPPTITKTATVAMMRLTSSHWGMLRKIIFIRLKRRRGAAICCGYCILFCWYLLYGGRMCCGSFSVDVRGTNVLQQLQLRRTRRRARYFFLSS